MTRARFACCAVALALCSWIAACGGEGDPDPGTETCGTPAILSPVGEAMRAAAPGMLAQCAGLPAGWLTAVGGPSSRPSFDPDGVSVETFRTRVAVQLLQTRSSFELASLNFNALWSGLTESHAIRELHDSLGGGTRLRDDQKPVLRFLYTNPRTDYSSGSEDPLPIDDAFVRLTQDLPASRADWNVRIVVKRCDRDITEGWNHSKLVIVDGLDATTSSFETVAYELALHLTGEPASLARAWFDEVFARGDNECRAGDMDDCWVNGRRGPQAPPRGGPTPSPGSPVNVFSLARGVIVDVNETRKFVSTADDALFAGIDATAERVFLLQPGLNGFRSLGASALVSRPLVRKLTEAVARRGVDVKVVWGEPEGQFDLDAGWGAVQDEVESTLSELEGDGEITPEEVDVSRCMIRAVPFGGMTPHASHAKFYMLDDGFYVGSQNLYPSELRLDPGQGADLVYPDLDDHGFYVDATEDVNHELTEEVIQRVVAPVWDTSASTAEVRAGRTACHQLPHRMSLEGTFALDGTSFACSTGALAVLDFEGVGWDEIARVTGTAICHPPSSEVGTRATFSGSIAVGGAFSGQLTWQDAMVDLTGTWTRGALNLTFGGAGGPSGTLVSGAGFVTISATSWGDPHLVTLDGLAYDFQAAGEFVAVESATPEPFTVQVRQQPWGSSRKVAVNTAVALRVGDDRVGVYAGRTEPLLVNGLAAPMADGRKLLLPGGGLVTRGGNTYAVEWPAGTGERVEIVARGDHLDLRVGAPPFRHGRLRGLLGDFDGDPGNDVATRGDGAILVSPTAADFYGAYAESWRVTEGESLFDYAEGESTGTFTDRTFPDQVVTSRQLTAEQRATAQLVCAAAGVTDPILLEACILDVALTGDGSFAAGAAATPPPATAYEMFVNLAAGRPVTVTGAYAGAGPQVVTDGVYAPEGTVWNDAQYAITIPAGTSLTLDLGAAYSIREVVAQVDNNDAYLVETSTDGVDWSASQVTVPGWGGAGLRTRPTLTLDPPVVLRYVRIGAASGDGMYSASELELRGPTTPVAP